MALVKDISDVERDKIYGIDTFSIRLGQKRVCFSNIQHLGKVGCTLLYIPWLFLTNLCQVFWICVFLFEMGFGVALLTGASSS
ncbi:hypothetical protein GYH30_056906 [Glycine max]|uniref:Uncharacterized protein n=1 Tax=Glycine max TaxID=3847 RepID=K7N5F9_SOYBN|nr:hypothetical protein GYH30_056906 [Glycine max]